MALHLWRTDLLARDLVNGSMSQSDAARYMMVGAVLYVQANYLSMWFGGYRDLTLLFEFIVVVVISLVGVHECFKANGADNGRDFLHRYCALAVPVGVKTTVASIVLGQVLYRAFPHVVTEESFRDPMFVYRLLSFVFVIAFAVVYFWRIAHHLGRIRATEIKRDTA